MSTNPYGRTPPFLIGFLVILAVAILYGLATWAGHMLGVW